LDHETHRAGQGNPLVETMGIRDMTMEIVDISADRGEVQLFQERSGVPEEVGPEWVRGSRQLLDKLLVPRDPRGIVLACGFVAAAALGISALVFGDPLGYAYLAGAAIGYFFLQTRLVPTTLWLLISFGGAAGALAGNTSDWIVCGLALLLAFVSLVHIPATYSGVSKPEAAASELRPLRAAATYGFHNGIIPESSRILEVPVAAGDEPAPSSAITVGDQISVVEAAGASISRPFVTPRAAHVLIRTMGRLRIEVNGRDLTSRFNQQPRLKFLFSYLLARTIRGVDAPIDRPALGDEVAPGISVASRLDRLRKQISKLKKTLGPEGKGLLQANSTHVRLDLSGVDIDIVHLEQTARLVARQKGLIDADLADQIRALLEETTGEFLADFAEVEQHVTGATQVVEEARVVISSWRADLVQALAVYNEADGHPQSSIAHLKSALDQSPQRQDLARLLIAAYLQTGQTTRASEARREYDLVQGR
jgi:DNA-binding SARP family transcriptional activator